MSSEVMDVRIGGWAWMPKAHFNDQQLRNLRRSLTIYPRKTTDIAGARDPEPIELYDEGEDWFGVPRGFYAEKRSLWHREIVDASQGDPMGEFPSLWTAEGPFAEQADMVRKLLSQLEGHQWGGVLLQAGCGVGKTNVALEVAYRLGRRTMILVHKEFFLDQWRERIEEFYPGARVGIVQQNRCEYEGRDFVIALLQSLSRDDGNGGRYPVELYQGIGTLIGDEIHRVSAQSWHPVIPRFPAAYRIALSATPRRPDGAENVFLWHVSHPTYVAKASSLVPQLRVLSSASQLERIARGSYRVAADKLNSAQVLSQLASDQLRNRMIVDDLWVAVQAGRKILVVSERLEHLRSMGRDLGAIAFERNYPVTIGYYTGEWFAGDSDKRVKRSREDLRAAESCQVIFGTKSIVSEGLDIPALDVVVLALPMGDVEQVVGRCRRWCLPKPGRCERLCPWRAGSCGAKPHPIVVDVRDPMVQQARVKARSRARVYERIGMQLP